MRKVSYRNKNKLKSEKQVYISFKKRKNYLTKITKKVFKIKK